MDKERKRERERESYARTAYKVRVGVRFIDFFMYKNRRISWQVEASQRVNIFIIFLLLIFYN